ncbi:hypothetical protein [Nonomuraea rhodomycinica]|uniref:Subtilisin inhibitor-like n=1 Tax=Nonomuraea rhodomycinica TaxID=1712872 RepID=A0A7Y6IQ30_9ACTN|nr:hypothetical protein [Nonomuraea rhodomycinica]NUW41004.1 hypothetical protein [Nonomuraea rhodomycinica]
MRSRLVACTSAVLLCLTGCANRPEPQAAPSSPATSAPSAPAASAPAASPAGPPTRRPSPRPSLAGPGTVCGEIQPPGDGPMAAVAISAGRAACGEALRTFRTYYRSQTPKQGSAGVATVGGWLCASNSAAQANVSGRLSTCRKGTARIVADVIP